MTASTFTGNKLLDLLCRGVAWVAPTRVYVSLHTANPGNTGVGEVTLAAWPAYVRKDAADGAAVATGFTAATGKSTANAKELLWPAMNGAANVTISHFALWDAPTGGNCLGTGALQASKILGPTDELVAHTGTLVVEVT